MPARVAWGVWICIWRGLRWQDEGRKDAIGDITSGRNWAFNGWMGLGRVWCGTSRLGSGQKLGIVILGAFNGVFHGAGGIQRVLG